MDLVGFISYLFDFMVESFDSFGIFFAFSFLVLFMIFQAIVAPIASEAVLTSAGGIFNEAFPVYGIYVAIAGGIIGSLLGAIVAFWIARKFKQWMLVYIEKNELKETFSPSLFDQFLLFLSKFIDDDAGDYAKLIEEKGFVIVLVGRILPFVPFDVVSYGAGFTSIRFKDFMIATTIGTIPRVIFYVLVGTNLATVLIADANLFILVFGIVVTIIYFLYKLTNRYVRSLNPIPEMENQGMEENSWLIK